jgi:hypothetical protein
VAGVVDAGDTRGTGEVEAAVWGAAKVVSIAWGATEVG